MVATRKESLIEKIIRNPDEFSQSDFEYIKKLIDDGIFTSRDFRTIFLRILDENVGVIKNQSRASTGIMGLFNKWSRFRRTKRFWKKIKTGNYKKVILAEGDSWFEYPVFIKDIVDHLIDEDDYAVYSQAFGGDWLLNIIYEQEYIEELSLLKPDIFLISASGNDLVGNYRLAKYIRPRYELDLRDDFDVNKAADREYLVQNCFNVEFFGLLKLFEVIYKLLFLEIFESQEKNKFKNLKIITQGYDYAIPNSRMGRKILRAIMRALTGNGKWLETPLLLRGYRNPLEQQAIIRKMIDDLNEMLIRAGKDIPIVHHVDCRGSVDSKDGWFDELHPTSSEFETIAGNFKRIIES